MSYEDHDYHGEDLEDSEDWDLEGTEEYFKNLERSAKRIIDTNFLEKVELSVDNLEAKYGKKGYPYYPYKYPSNYKELPISSRLELIEKRLNALMEWATKQGMELSKCPYKDTFATKKTELESRIAGELKDTYPIIWNSLSETAKRDWVSDILRKASIKSTETLGSLEKLAINQGRPLIKDFDKSWKDRKCFLCGFTFDSFADWNSFLEHMSKFHVSAYESWIWALSVLEPERYHKTTREETSKGVEKSLQHQRLESREERIRRGIK